ncbi:MAG: class I mannose-6-phosphate isomerase [Clostridia bacterium]|nr:class I mannose-6-phosphate isomerase [Clostridia bacterium]
MYRKPVKLNPVFKDYLWGGTKLKTEFKKKTDLDIVAESWELSAHKDGQSTIIGGEFDGLTLMEFMDACGKETLGSKAAAFDYFPILIKLIDAKNDLSVQVHPDDAYALKVEGEYGKTEMWYVLDCEKDAALYYGFSKEITEEEYRQAIANNTLTDCLNRVPVSKGDVFFIPAGTVHAIGAGILICEIQQNSNTTYRVYDYNRKDKNGNTRELHVEKAIAVSDLKPAPKREPIADGERSVLASCSYFTVERLRVNGTIELNVDKTSFQSLMVTEGAGELLFDGETLSISKGDSVLIPAIDATYQINGNCEIILSYL